MPRPGHFSPAGFHQIVSGLAEGDRIVVAGTFLIDSESRMKAATGSVDRETATDPVCGMAIDVNTAKTSGKSANHNGFRTASPI